MRIKLLAVVATIVVAHTGCFPLTGRRSTDLPTPRGSIPRPMPPVATSTLSTSIDIPVHWLTDAINGAVPNERIAAHAWTYLDNGPVGVKFAVRRNPFAVTGIGDTIVVGTDLRYKIAAHYRVNNWFKPSASCAWDSDDAFDPPAVPARVELAAVLSAASDWTIVPSMSLRHLDSGPCRVTFFNINIAPIAIRVLRENMIDGKLAQAQSTLAQRLAVRAAVERLWKRAFEPFVIDSGLSIGLFPVGTKVSRLRVERDTFRLRVGLDLRPVVWLGAQPSPQKASALPPVVEAVPDSAFVLRTPIVVGDSLLQRLIADTLVGLSLRRKAGPFTFATQVSGVSVFSVGDTAVVAVDLSGKINGRAYILGVPTYNAATREFRLTDIQFTADSRSFLSRVGFALGSEAILNAIRVASIVPLGATIDETRARLNAAGTKQFGPFRLNVVISELSPLGIFRATSGFAALIEMRGSARITGIQAP